MNLKKIIAGLFLILLLSGCEQQLLKTNVFILETSHVRGGIISTNLAELKDLLKEIPGKENYSNIIILSSTNHQTPTHKIFTYDSFKEKIIINQDLIKEFTATNKILNLGEITGKSWWNKSFINVLKNDFPNSKFVILSINENLNESEIKKLTEILKASLPLNSIVLATSNFKKSSNKNVQNFQNEFIENSLMNFNEPSHVAIKTLQSYLESIYSLKPFANNFLYERGEIKQNNEIFLVTFGDIMLGRFVRTLMETNGLDYPFAKMEQNYFKLNDLLIANLEGPISDKAVRTSKGIAFRFPSDTGALLKKYSFDLLSLANNHSLDMGENGYLDSRAILEQQGLKPFGKPNEIESALVEIKDQRLAFLGLEDVTFKLNEDLAVTKIKELVSQNYQVIPFIHWGIEYTHKPNKRQQDLAHKFIDAGATMIIGHHPHVVQAYENYNGKPIFYSLGNAIFDQYFSNATQEGLSLGIIIKDGELEIYLVPINIKKSQMSIMNNQETTKFLERFVEYGNFTYDEKKEILSGKILIR